MFLFVLLVESCDAAVEILWWYVVGVCYAQTGVLISFVSGAEVKQ